MKKSLVLNTSLNFLMAFALVLVLMPNGFAKKKGGGGKPGTGSDPCANSNAMFPALIYSTHRADVDGPYYDLNLASRDGCKSVTVESSEKPSSRSIKLRYSEVSKTGFYAWVDYPVDQNPRVIIWRQWFSINSAGELMYEDTQAIYTSPDNRVIGFDLRENGSRETLVLTENSSVLLIDDIDNCSQVTPTCTIDDAVPLYSTAIGDCLADSVSGSGCYVPLFPLLNLSADKLYASFYYEPPTGETPPYSIAQFSRDAATGTWGPAQLLIDGSVYREARLESISENGKWLAIDYLDINQTEPSGHRIIFLELDQGYFDPLNPILAEELSLGQNMMFRHASWTPDDSVFVIGSEGKGRKATDIVVELDPFTGDTKKLEIILDGPIEIDSNL